jgi:hypothetical protein
MDHLTTALHMLDRLHGDDSPLLADVYVALFNLYVDARMVPQGVEALRRAVDIAASADGEDVDFEINRLLLRLLTEPDHQVARAREALEISEGTYGPVHPRTAETYRLLSALLRGLGELDEAQQMAARAADIDRSNYGPRHFRVASDIVSMLAVDTARGDFGAAEARLREMAEIVVSAHADDRDAWLRDTGLLDVLAEATANERSAPLFELAVETLDEAFAPDQRLLGSARALLMTALQIGGDMNLREARIAESALLYNRGLQLARLTTENFLDDSAFEIKLALVHAKGGDAAATQAYIQAAMESLSRTGHPAPIWYVTDELSKLAGAIGRVPLVEATVAKQVTETIEGDAVSTFRPRLTAAIPPEWFAKESTTLLAPDGQANVIASAEPLDPTVDSERYAAVQGDLLREDFPDYEEKEFAAVTIFGGRSGYMRSFEWTPPDGVRVAQIQLYYAENGRGYTATATTPLENFPKRELLLRQLLLALRIAN